MNMWRKALKACIPIGQFAILVLVAAGVGLAATTLKSDGASPSVSTVETNSGRFVASLASATNAIIIVANPANCAMDTAWASAINRTRRIAHLRGVVLVVGMVDSVSAGAAVRDLGLDFEVRVSSASASRALLASVTVPAIAVVRSGKTVLIATGQQFESASGWLPVALGVHSSLSTPK